MALPRTVIIAPKTDLMMVDDEVQQVNNLLNGKLLQGSQATLNGALAILSEPTDIIWFATHGNGDGVQMLDGLLSTSEITSLVRSCGARLVVFNTCSSKAVARKLFQELRIELICTVKAVPDRSAFVTGTIFARKVADGFSYREAYELAKPGQNSIYLFLPESVKMNTNSYPEKKAEDLPNNFNTMFNLLNRLQVIVLGSADYNVPGLVSTVNELTKEANKAGDTIELILRNQALTRKINTFLIIICTLLIVAVVALIYRQASL